MENSWYIYRNELQYGPYPEEQMRNMMNQNQLLPGDSFLNRDYSPYMINYETMAGLLSSPRPQPMNNGTFQPVNSGVIQPANNGVANPTNRGVVQPMKKPRKKIARIFLIAAGLIVVLFVGLVIWGLTLSGSDNLKLSKTEEIGSATMEKTGGVLTINDAKSNVNGLSITVPEGAYDKSIDFKVSTAVIDEHKFGTDFNPVTPLITIDNGHLFSNELMTVSIPISIGAEDFAMAFYYDRDSGNLEGIPVVSLDENQITIMTSHFSDIVVTDIAKAKLETLTIGTKFEPGLDDWQFTNYGSYIEPSGHCAGQSISSMWYFYEKYQKAGEQRLFGRFDNNGRKIATKKLDADDSWSYRFASVVQRKLDFDSISKKIFNAFRGTFDDLTYYSFAYSLLITKQPQYTGICHYDKNGDFAGGHALVAYKIVNNLIYVADPNYPGITTRTINYDIKSSAFTPYESGETAKEIEDGKSVGYTHIGYFAVSSMINWSVIGDEYAKMIQGKSGDGLFPADTVFYVVGRDSNGKTTTKPLTDGYVITTKEMKQFSPTKIGKIFIAPKIMDKDAVYQIYAGATYLNTSTDAGLDVSIGATIELKPGDNDVGIGYYHFTKDKKLRYVNFYRFNVKYIADPESSESESSLSSSSSSSSSNPTPTKAATPTITPKPTQPAVKEYDYKAALAVWIADCEAGQLKKLYDDGSCKTTYVLEWVMRPVIKDGSVIGASKLWETETYYGARAGEKSKTWESVFTYSAESPGVFISLGELRDMYPQFEPK